MTKIIIYLIIISLLLPASVAASGQSTTIPSSITSPIATSLNVELVGTWPVEEAIDLYVYGNQAYVAHHFDWYDPPSTALLSILDISDPARPTEIDHIEGPYGDSYQSVYVDLSYIYTASSSPSIVVYQKTDLENYVCFQKFSVYSKVIEMWSHSGYGLFVNANYSDYTGNGLQVFKPVPTEPYDHCEFVTTYEITGKVTAATYDDQYAYIGTADGALWILDFSDPKLPSKVSQTPYGSLPIDAIAAAPGYVYLAQDDEIKIVDVSDPASPGAAQSFTSPVKVAQLGAQGGYLYITFEDDILYWKDGLYIYDVRNSSAPVQAGYYLDYDEKAFGNALHLANDLVFAADERRMYILRFTGAQPLPHLLLQPLQEGIEINGVLAPFPCVLPGNTEESVQDEDPVDCLTLQQWDQLEAGYKELAANKYVDCPEGFIELLMQMLGWQEYIATPKEVQEVQMRLLFTILENICKKPASFSSNPLGYQSITDGSVGLKLDQGAVRFKVAHEAMILDIVTESATTRSTGANDFGVANYPDTALSLIACYQGTVEVQPSNPALSPLTLQPGYWVEVTSENVGPITEIIYQTFVPLIVNQGPTNSAGGLIMDMKELFESQFSNP
jgi:hypothetical protein